MPGVSDQAALRVAWQGDVGDYAIALAWSGDGLMLAAAAVSGPIAIFDGQTGKLIHRLPGHGFGTTDLSWNLDGTLLASSGQDGLARVWDVRSGSERFSVIAGASWVEHISWSPSGKFLATAAGKHLRIWKESGTHVAALRDAASTITAIAWKPGTNALAMASYGRLDVVDAETDRSLQTIDWKLAALAIAWSPDGQILATGDQDASAHLWNMTSHEPLRMWGYQTKVRELAWDASGRYLATGGGPQATVWDRSALGSPASEPIVLRNRNATTISALAFRPEGCVLASGDQQGDVAVWEVAKHSQRLATHALGAEISHLRWEPRGQRLAASTADGLVVVFDPPPFSSHM